MPAKIIRGIGTLADLELHVNRAMEDGYSPTGGPFHSPESRTWSQMMSKPEPIRIQTGEVRLQEPAVPLFSHKDNRKRK